MNKQKPTRIAVIGEHSQLIEAALNSANSTNAEGVGVVVCSIDPSTLDDSNKQYVHLIPVNEDGMVVGIDGRSWKYNAENIINNAKNYPLRIPGDYHHASMNAAESGAKAPASGWIEPSTITAEADGIWATVEWTVDAANAIRNKEFLYTSPVFNAVKATGEILALKGFALTHYPNLGDLTPVANQQTMEDSKMEELLERFKYMLNLPELATPEEILAALNEAVRRIQAMLKDGSSEEANTQDKTLVALLDDMQAQMATLAANSQRDLTDYVPRGEFDKVKSSLDAITAAAESERVATEVNNALEKGLIIPASRAWAEDYCKKDPQGFADFCANAAQTIPLGEETHAAQATGALTDDEINMCTQLGISQDDYKKTKDLEVGHGTN